MLIVLKISNYNFVNESILDNLITPDLWMNNCHSRSPSSSDSTDETMPKINNIAQTFVPRPTSTNLQISLQPSKNKLKRTSDVINENDIDTMSSTVLSSSSATAIAAATICHKSMNKKRRLPATRSSGGFVNRQCTTELRAKPIAQLTNNNLQNTPNSQAQNIQYQQQQQQQHQPQQQQQQSFKSSFPPNFFHLRPPLRAPHLNIQGPEDIRMNPKLMNPLAPITLVPYPIPIILPMVIPIPIPMNAIDFLKAYHLHDHKMKETKTKEEESITTTTAATTTATARTVTATIVDNNNYNEPIDYTKSKNNDISLVQGHLINEQTTDATDTTDTTTETNAVNNVERKLPKFKITRLNSKRHFTKEFIESCRPLRKRKRIIDNDEEEEDDKELSS